MLFYDERKDRPGLTHIIGRLRGLTDTGMVLSVASGGVLVTSGPDPKMDGTTLVYTPTPTMADTVMRLS